MPFMSVCDVWVSVTLVLEVLTLCYFVVSESITLVVKLDGSTQSVMLKVPFTESSLKDKVRGKFLEKLRIADFALLDKDKTALDLSKLKHGDTVVVVVQCVEF